MYGRPSREAQPSMVIVSPGLIASWSSPPDEHHGRVGLGAPFA
jgi:hypothetical protein